MQVRNVGKRTFCFEDFEIKKGEVLEVEGDLVELVEIYPAELKIVEIKKVVKAKKAEPKAEEPKAK